ncbi:hypothetical protein ACLOJK_023576 [Asimina triloba]
MAAYERPWCVVLGEEAWLSALRKNTKSGTDDQQRGGGDLAEEEKETYLNEFSHRRWQTRCALGDGVRQLVIYVLAVKIKARGGDGFA